MKAPVESRPPIKIIPAAPEETVLIREAFEDSVPETVDGMPLLTGRIHGQEVCLTPLEHALVTPDDIAIGSVRPCRDCSPSRSRSSRS